MWGCLGLNPLTGHVILAITAIIEWLWVASPPVAKGPIQGVITTFNGSVFTYNKKIMHADKTGMLNFHKCLLWMAWLTWLT